MTPTVKPTMATPTVKLTVNGLPHESDAATLAELWQRETEGLDAASPRGFAISLNGVVVRRAAWAATRLADGDTVEIIRAMSGG